MELPYGAMDATTAAVTTHVYLIQAVVLWVAAVVVVLVYGPRDLSRHPRQMAQSPRAKRNVKRLASSIT